MNRQSAVVHIVGLFAEQVKQLGITHGYKEIKAVISVTHDEEQGSFPVSQSIQLQLIISRDLTQLCNVEHGKASAAGNQNRLIKKSFRAYNTGGQLIFLILAHRKVVWLLGFQCIKHQVYGVFELLVILTDFHGVDELNEGGEVLFLHRSLIMDIANKRAVQQGFCFYPEIVSGLAFAFGIGDQRCYQLQDVLFAMDIGERVIVHGLLEVDGI